MFKKLLITAAVLASAAAHAQIAGSTGFTVTGSIVPSPCTLTLSGSGIAAFGAVSSGSVIANGINGTTPVHYTIPGSKILNLLVTCPTPSKMALEFTDNRLSSLDGNPDGLRWGVGTYTPTGGTPKNIGSYNITYLNTTIKATPTGIAVAPLRSLFQTGVATTGGTWVGPLVGENVAIPPGKSLALAALPTATTPDSLVEIKMEMVFIVEPVKAVVDAATSAITLDGSGTVTLIVL